MLLTSEEHGFTKIWPSTHRNTGKSGLCVHELLVISFAAFFLQASKKTAVFIKVHIRTRSFEMSVLVLATEQNRFCCSHWTWISAGSAKQTLSF